VRVAEESSIRPALGNSAAAAHQGEIGSRPSDSSDRHSPVSCGHDVEVGTSDSAEERANGKRSSHTVSMTRGPSSDEARGVFLSRDGHWVWNGREWVPASPSVLTPAPSLLRWSDVQPGVRVATIFGIGSTSLGVLAMCVAGFASMGDPGPDYPKVIPEWVDILAWSSFSAVGVGCLAFLPIILARHVHRRRGRTLRPY
jgi:hypothetical protein